MIDERSQSLIADCANCVGLCCVALAFARSEDFAFRKDAGEECRNLTEEYRCRVHPTLRADGMKGCTVFDCHGAGQRVTNTVFPRTSWRDSPEVAMLGFAVFGVVRQLHEMLGYLAAAARIASTPQLDDRIESQYSAIDELSGQLGEQVLQTDVDGLRETVNTLLAAASEGARKSSRPHATTPLPKGIRAGADLIGAALPHQDLRGADLRGALLIAADLSGADLRESDLLAADLRDTNLCGADLSSAMFVTQMQLNAARGDDATAIPPGMVRPSHWT